VSLVDWPNVVAAAGLPVALHNGWPNTPKPNGSMYGLAGLLWHHDATPSGPTPGGLDWIISSYNAGDSSAQLWQGYDGTWHFCGAGMAWHAGNTRSSQFSNQYSVGLETDHTTGESYPAAQLDSIQRGIAAICSHEGWDSSNVGFHKTEATPAGRKQDPWFDSFSNNQGNWEAELSQHRSAIQRYIDGGATPAPGRKGRRMAFQIDADGSLNMFAVGTDGRLYQQWPDKSKPGGWSGWIAGIPGKWAGDISVTFDKGYFSILGTSPDGDVQQAWSSTNGWNGPVGMPGIKVAV
jgi:N-acetylmuramoyl-L-alanine amidase